MLVALLHLVYLRLCLPFRMRIELAAGEPGAGHKLAAAGDACCAAGKPGSRRTCHCRRQGGQLWAQTHTHTHTRAHGGQVGGRVRAAVHTHMHAHPPTHRHTHPAAAEMVASCCDLGVFVCGIILVVKTSWTTAERRSMGLAMLVMQVGPCQQGQWPMLLTFTCTCVASKLVRLMGGARCQGAVLRSRSSRAQHVCKRGGLASGTNPPLFTRTRARPAGNRFPHLHFGPRAAGRPHHRADCGADARGPGAARQQRPAWQLRGNPWPGLHAWGPRPPQPCTLPPPTRPQELTRE